MGYWGFAVLSGSGERKIRISILRLFFFRSKTRKSRKSEERDLRYMPSMILRSSSVMP